MTLETNNDLCVVTLAFAADDSSGSVFGVLYYCTCL